MELLKRLFGDGEKSNKMKIEIETPKETIIRYLNFPKKLRGWSETITTIRESYMKEILTIELAIHGINNKEEVLRASANYKTHKYEIAKKRINLN